MDPEYITIGQILRPWGVKGEIKVEVMTDFPDRFSPRQEIYIKHRTVTIEGSRWQRGQVILKLKEIDNIESAEVFRGQFIEIHRSQVSPLAENEYYRFQLTGLEVWTTEGDRLGHVSDILSTGSNDVMVVPYRGAELLIPTIEDVVKSVDLDAGRVVIELIEGILP